MYLMFGSGTEVAIGSQNSVCCERVSKLLEGMKRLAHAPLGTHWTFYPIFKDMFGRLTEKGR